jgi:hypothetical protein
MSVVQGADMSVPVAAVRGKKVVASTATASVLRRGVLYQTADEAVVALQSAGCSDLSEFTTQNGKAYGVCLMVGASAVAVLMSPAQERAFVRRAFAGKALSWKTLAALTTPVAELGTHFVLSDGLSLSILEPRKRARAESEDLEATEGDDNDDLAGEDGGVEYELKIKGRTLRAFRLGLANAALAWGVHN